MSHSIKKVGHKFLNFASFFPQRFGYNYESLQGISTIEYASDRRRNSGRMGRAQSI